MSDRFLSLLLNPEETLFASYYDVFVAWVELKLSIQVKMIWE